MKDLLNRIKEFLKTKDNEYSFVLDFEKPSEELLKVIKAYAEYGEGNTKAWQTNKDYYNELTYLAFELDESGQMKMFRALGSDIAELYGEKYPSTIVNYYSYSNIEKQPKRKLDI